MKKSLDAISPYYEVSNIRDSRQLKVFTVQFAAVFSRANAGTGSMDNV